MIALGIVLRDDHANFKRHRAAMSDQDTNTDVRFFAAFQRPAWVIMMVAQMLLGVGLAVALVVKYYMAIFGVTGACLPDTETIGNLIRCTPTLEMVSHFIFGVAGFRFAAVMFQDRIRAIFPPLILSFAGVLLLFVQNVTPPEATWSVAAVIVALLGCVAAATAARILLDRLTRSSK
ncbi:hypothetical protein [Sedimentitalea sp.]|uniref:hypothetical protein n=1 Tax=Sedimentitalea sp. TaxID=2048915 RepID=UPI0032998793